MSIDDPNDERWQQLRAHLDALQLRAWSHATTLRIARLRDGSEYRFNTASGVLIELDGRAVVGTAWHVLDQYRTLRDSGEDVLLLCDAMPIPQPHTVFRDERRDLALLDIPYGDRDQIRAVPYRPRRLWPPPQVAVGDEVLVCGFPKLLRVDGPEILHGDFNMHVSVESASEHHFMLQPDYSRMISAGRVELPREHLDYGGVSGGPVFLSDSECAPLVGIVSQAGESLPLWRVSSLAQLPGSLTGLPSAPV